MSAAMTTTQDGEPRQVSGWPDVLFTREKHWLVLRLPSGRHLRLFDPRIEQEPGFTAELMISGPPHADSTKSKRQSNGHYASKLHGGALTEYLICGTARDMLSSSLVRLEQAGLLPVGHIHDEAVVEAALDALADMRELMLAHPPWARAYGVDVEFGALSRYRKL
jgi:DNA polymerase